MEKLNVAIADDNVRMADILGQMIEEDKDLTLVGKAHNGEEICSNRMLLYWISLCRRWMDLPLWNTAVMTVQ